MKMHFIGCLGASMSPLMDIMKANGMEVGGSDAGLRGHDKKNVVGADVIVYSSAIASDNCEMQEAKRLGIPCISRADLLGQISGGYDKVVAVAGSHGKTSTTAMLGCILGRRNPTIHLGGVVCDAPESDKKVLRGGSRVGGKNYFVTEACEYRRNFLSFDPTIGVVLNVEMDHTDCYQDQRDYEQAFLQFGKQSDLVVVHSKYQYIFDKSVHMLTFGEEGDYQVKSIAKSNKAGRPCLEFDCMEYGNLLGRFCVYGVGEYNVSNALAAIASARVMLLDATEIQEGLQNFVGVKRRFEVVGSGECGTLVCDYAHHPTEIQESIQAARGMTLKGGKVRVVFQPHTYTRTQSLATGFAHALSLADEIALVPIYPARENPLPGVTSHSIGDKIKSCHYFESLPDAKQFLKGGRKQDITLVMGAGDIDTIL